jgi:hypothetical protein
LQLIKLSLHTLRGTDTVDVEEALGRFMPQMGVRYCDFPVSVLPVASNNPQQQPQSVQRRVFVKQRASGSHCDAGF